MSPESLVIAAQFVRVAPSPKHGLGVFAARTIPEGTVVHVAPVMLMSDEDVETLEDTALRGLVYGWDTDVGTSALALGYGSLFNHDPDANCVYHRIDADDVDAESGQVLGYDALQYSTLREVPEGEELTIDYSGGDPSMLWFDVV
jgi:uncharacterized protein